MHRNESSSPIAPSAHLERRLLSRHVYMMSLGGAIGVGLFLGSGGAISIAGPALLIAYALVGTVVYCVMRALGEMSVHSPVSGSFSEYARMYVGGFAGFASGWMYWLWSIACPMAELTAAGVFMHYWFPSLPQWIPALIGLVGLYAVHWTSVRLFGEFEYWFAIIKVVAIVGLILLGAIVLITGWTALSHGATISNLWNHGGFFPKGAKGVFLALQLAVFAFIGIEQIGMTAGEAADPEKTMPRAVNNVIWRILVFYIGALFILMTVQPWTQYSDGASPFVATLSKAGIAGAAGILNFVVLTSALSAGNASLFSGSRLLFSLSHAGSAPRALRHVSHRNVPVAAVTVMAACSGVGVLINYVAPGQAFTYVTSVATIGGLSSWAVIALAHMGLRRSLRRTGQPLPAFRLPGAPWTSLFVLAATAAAAISMGFTPGTRVGLYSGGVAFVLIVIAYAVKQRRSRREDVPTAEPTVVRSQESVVDN
ncbi:amino acid permease [Streptomyces tendae]|uniref:amino acid permease n=1 Tax=Streptomyces tendae TaxID=1932 RepID=UPI00367745E7